MSNGEGAHDIYLTRSNLAKHVNNQTPLVSCFDETQVTSPRNLSNCKPGTAALTRTGRTPSVAYSIWPEGGQGADLRAAKCDVSPALTATELARGTDRGVRIVCATGETTHALTRSHDASEDGTGRGTPIASTSAYAVRRLTPLECERLQGFPDGWTDIPGASNTARYAALGNSMAVPVMRWLGERITVLDGSQ